jgi:transcriptional regulator of arginine metabolism
MKIQRHAAILRVVRERRIESQDELREALSDDGFVVTQATLSRDIRELGLAKLADPQGGAYYTHPNRSAVRPDLAQILPALLVSLDGVGPFLVLKTASGSAGAVTEALMRDGRRSSGRSPAMTPFWSLPGASVCAKRSLRGYRTW